jgi:hypothetical protein
MMAVGVSNTSFHSSRVCSRALYFHYVDGIFIPKFCILMTEVKYDKT